MSETKIVEREAVVITRTFGAPVERVYQAWTDPQLMVKWFSSNVRWRTPIIDIEPVVGGKHDITMRHSDGDQYHLEGRYLELTPNTRISFTWKVLESLGGTNESIVTVEFRPVDAGTELTLTHTKLTDAERDGTSSGWDGCLEMLERYIESGVGLKEPD